MRDNLLIFEEYILYTKKNTEIENVRTNEGTNLKTNKTVPILTGNSLTLRSNCLCYYNKMLEFFFLSFRIRPFLP